MKRAQLATRSIFGKWSMATALLADPSNPLPALKRDTIAVRLRDCLTQLREAPEPPVDAWRDVVDCMNWLKACEEAGWVSDEGGVIPAGKDAILEAHENHAQHGKLRLSGRGLDALTNMVNDTCELLEVVTARQYWSAVRAAEKHITEALRGKVRPGDTVVRI